MLTKTLGLIVARSIARAHAAVVLMREFHTFCLKPAVQRRVGSSTFWPARLTTAVVPLGRPSFSSSCQLMCFTPGIREIVVTS
uniref:Putative secreted protein n=1 Tax=Anopheles triannulatus TaxID=58253 RepID=A0A2M4B313_9DIPT